LAGLQAAWVHGRGEAAARLGAGELGELRRHHAVNLFTTSSPASCPHAARLWWESVPADFTRRARIPSIGITVPAIR
jgi:hypothetical protein